MAMKTTLYLLGHGSTEPRPGRSPGRIPRLAAAGRRQAAATRDFLAVRPLDGCFSSPLRPALETAVIVAGPHGLTPQLLHALTDSNPDREPLTEVQARAGAALEELFQNRSGQTLLIVSHPNVIRAYLASLLGLSPRQSHQLAMDSCGISVVVRHGPRTAVSTLNAAFHLQGVAA